ncbi:hypothetical protein COLO4_05997 [Corchorus olitorius]|uniref:Uncharacterized protein n=1 Tax=Corchorus olitorius TaxID=93759 RepID=A0A1R3KPB3_9ROSI|nr:hypothetical protein COLO4_05997 [Corchorus olitorius]
MASSSRTRDCSWTDSSTDSMESEEEGNVVTQGMHPPPSPMRRERISPLEEVGTEELVERRREGLECLQPALANRLARHAGDVLEIDWANTRPRNIRFLRVRIRIDPWKPLLAGVSFRRDDGVVQWAEFQYEQEQEQSEVQINGGHEQNTTERNDEVQQQAEPSASQQQVQSLQQPEEGQDDQTVHLNISDEDIVPIPMATGYGADAEQVAEQGLNGDDLTMSPFNFELEPMLDLEETRERMLSNQLEGVEHRITMENVIHVLTEEHARVEASCDDMIKQHQELMDGFQRRFFNDPFLQPCDNIPRWINWPDGGVMFTNGRLLGNSSTEQGESSRMGESRNREKGMMHQNELLFQVEMEVIRTFIDASEEERRYRFNCQWEGGTDTGQQTNEQGNMTNEERQEAEALANSFLKSQLSPIPENEENEVDRDASQSPKRKRESDEEELGRQLRRRMENLDVNAEATTTQTSQDNTDQGLRQAGPQQPPQEP